MHLAGGLVFVLKRLELRTGASDLIINRATHTVTLPLTFGRREPVTLPIAEIEDFVVEERESQSGSYSYAALLRCKDRGQVIQLAKWSDRIKLENFVHWLRQELGIAKKNGD